MTRSALAGEGIRRAKEGNNLGRMTQSLFYATDFVDRLENENHSSVARRVHCADRIGIFIRLIAHGPWCAAWTARGYGTSSALR